MELVVQKQIDLTATLIKGLNSLKHSNFIDFDYYSIKSFSVGGSEIMLADQMIGLVRMIGTAFDEKLDVLLVSEIDDDKTDYYFYVKDHKFDENIFKKLVELKPLYSHIFELEQNWTNFGIEISTFNVSGCDDCCLLVSFNSKKRSV